jgi:hypothetical protein
MPKNRNGKEDGIISYVCLESRLSYLAAAMKESFRLTPTAQNPMPGSVPSFPAPPTIIARTRTPPQYGCWCQCLLRTPRFCHLGL